MQAVSRWQARVEAAEPDVERVLGEEREEAALRKAEMEANKAAVRCWAWLRWSARGAVAAGRGRRPARRHWSL